MQCPYCGSFEFQGVSAPHVSLANNGVWDIEQVIQCTNPKCHKEYVSVYKFLTNIPIEKSSVFSPSDGD